MHQPESGGFALPATATDAVHRSRTSHTIAQPGRHATERRCGRLRPKAGLALAALLLYAASADAAELLLGGYGIGLGRGSSDTKGDFIDSKKLDAFTMGFDVETDGFLFLFNGTADLDPDTKAASMSFVVAGGWRYLKIGTGFVTQESSVPTTAASPHPLFPTDTARPTQISVTAIPVYLRLHPWVSDNLVLSLDGYYGVYSRGSMEIPLAIGVGSAYLRTEPEKAGGTKGLLGMATWKTPGNNPFALRLSYGLGYARMDRQQTGVRDDPLGLTSGVDVPEISYRNTVAMLSVFWVFRHNGKY